MLWTAPPPASLCNGLGKNNLAHSAALCQSPATSKPNSDDPSRYFHSSAEMIRPTDLGSGASLKDLQQCERQSRI
jgi:hypothetical protein